MVKGTYAKQALAREVSCSSQKNQPVPSIVEEEVVARSGTLFELDLLDCPFCCHSLTSPIFQVWFLLSHCVLFGLVIH